MTTRSRWDDMRSLIEAGQAQPTGCGWCGEHVARPCRSNWEASVCKRGGQRQHEIDWDDIKRAEADADRMLYGGLGTPQRED